MKVIAPLILTTLLANFINCQPSTPLHSVPRVNSIEEFLDWELWLSIDTLIQAVRLRHGIQALNFNDTLSKMARQKALVRAWYHNEAPKDGLSESRIGENFFLNPDPAAVLNGSEIMSLWYTEGEKNFNYENQVITESNVYFLNLVAPQVEDYGCGQVRGHKPYDVSPSNGHDGVGVYIVCLFYPAISPEQRDESFDINLPLFRFEDSDFNFSMTDDLRNGLFSRLEGRASRPEVEF